MRTFKLIAAIGLLLFAAESQAQVSVHINIGSPPSWGPAGYSTIRYYYLPDVRAFYDIRLSQFIFLEGRTWVHRPYLPHRYRNYDLYRGYKVVLKDYYGDTPYERYREYRTKYANGRNREIQRTIGGRNEHGDDRRYYQQNRHDDRGNDRYSARKEKDEKKKKKGREH